MGLHFLCRVRSLGVLLDLVLLQDKEVLTVAFLDKDLATVVHALVKGGTFPQDAQACCCKVHCRISLAHLSNL